MSVSFSIVEPHIGLITLNRPQVRNAMDWPAMEAFARAVAQAEHTSALGALVVTGAGQAFSAGGDFKALAQFRTQADGRRLAEGMSHNLARLAGLPCPTIAAINGPARGGGAEIALACDLRVIAANADLGLVQITLGLTPGWGGGQRLLRLVGYSRALAWLTSGAILSAEEAVAHGLANRLAPEGSCLTEALTLARTIASHPPAAVQAIKRLLLAGLAHSPTTAAALEMDEFPALWVSAEHLQRVDELLNRKRA